MTPIVDPREYYAGADVRQRIREYCGASAGHPPTCAFVSELAPGGHVTWATAPRFSTEALPRLFDRGWDISRSLEDQRCPTNVSRLNRWRSRPVFALGSALAILSGAPASGSPSCGPFRSTNRNGDPADNTAAATDFPARTVVVPAGRVNDPRALCAPARGHELA